MHTYLRVRMTQWASELDYLTTHTSLSPIRREFASGFVNYKKGCARLAVASDTAYQLLAHGRWFSPGTLASSTTKTGRHYVAEILLKVALNTKTQIKSNHTYLLKWLYHARRVWRSCICVLEVSILPLFLWFSN